MPAYEGEDKMLHGGDCAKIMNISMVEGQGSRTKAKKEGPKERGKSVGEYVLKMYYLTPGGREEKGAGL